MEAKVPPKQVAGASPVGDRTVPYGVYKELSHTDGLWPIYTGLNGEYKWRVLAETTDPIFFNCL